MPSSSSTTTPSHPAKRPYAGSHTLQHQPAITSYFANSSSSTTTSSSASRSLPPPSPPFLPPLVQSNLLSVGMRVRKSVPEGYKTGLRKHVLYSSPCSFGVGGRFADGVSAVPASAPVPAAARLCGAAVAGGATSARRELTPFCGLMKVGGLAVQGWGYGRARDEDEEENENEKGLGGEVFGGGDVMGLSAQRGMAGALSVYEGSMAGTATGSRYKRRFDEQEEDEVVVEIVDGEPLDRIWRDDDLQLSPKTKPISVRIGPGLGLDFRKRAMAVPKSRLNGRGAWAVGGGNGLKMATLEGQENKHVVDVDFGEAGFLDYGLRDWDAGEGVEVVMRDV